MTEPAALSVAGLAVRWAVPKSTVRGLLAPRGPIPIMRLSPRCIRIRLADIEAYEERVTEAAPQSTPVPGEAARLAAAADAQHVRDCTTRIKHLRDCAACMAWIQKAGGSSSRVCRATGRPTF